MSSTPLALALARRAAQLGARAGVAACLVAPALIAGRIRFTRSISGKPKE